MIISIVLVLISLAVLVLVHEFGHFLVSKLSGVSVEEFGVGFPPAIVKKKIGETIYSVNWIFAGGFVKLLGEEQKSEQERSFSRAPWLVRIGIIAGGVLMNFILGWLIISLLFFKGIPAAVVVTDVAPNSPAQAAGILPNDHILRATVQGENFSFGGENAPQDFTQFVNGHRGQLLQIEIERDGQKKEIAATPRKETPQGEGALGVAIVDAGIPPESVLLALKDGLVSSLSIIGRFFAFLGQAITGRASLSQISGPVGVFKIGVAASREGLDSFLELFALISLNLAVFNILPIPALDGGKLLFLIIEKIRGAPVAVHIEQKAAAVSFAALILLLLIITIKDIGMHL